MSHSSNLTTAPHQLRLDLEIAVEREVNGVGMGVLKDGTPYLNLRGLAELCGVDHTMIVRITADWMQTPLRPREQKIRELVRAQGADDRIAFWAVNKNGTIHHILPAPVCMAVLEYYAFEARTDSGKAARSYRLLARKGFTDFIYAQVGYNPTGAPAIAWKQFQDRVSLTYHTVPDGYFSIFKEAADIIVTLIRAGADVGPHFVPDISIGHYWSRYWKAESLDIIHGERVKYDHNYPSYFPQAPSNPQECYCYPDEALGEFRKWMREDYLPKYMPPYLNKKVSDGAIPAPEARKALDAFASRQALPARR